jgi:hypothetical protein
MYACQIKSNPIMSAATDRFRRQMSADWPRQPRDWSETYVVTSTSAAPSAKPELFIQWGMWMARENGVVRAATEQEIADFMAGVAI